MQNYSLLICTQKSIPDIKFVFPLHEGENIIGTNKDLDISLNLPENDIDPIHAKITVNKQQSLLDIGIKILKSPKAYIKREENKKILIPGKEYELSKNCTFYLNDYTKFKLIKGTIEEIRTIFISENLENEFRKWHKKIIIDEKESKINSCKYSKNEYNIKNGKDVNNFLNVHKIPSNNYKIYRNGYFTIPKGKDIIFGGNDKNSTSKYLAESFSTSFSSNKFNKNSNNLTINTRNLLNLFNINIDADKIDNIYQERKEIIRELLGENGLDDIFNCTNYHKIKKYDQLYYSSLKNRKYISFKH